MYASSAVRRFGRVIPSSNGMAIVTSDKFPGFRATAPGGPSASASPWILLVAPSREMPTASDYTPFEVWAERCGFTCVLSRNNFSGIGPAAAIFSNLRCQIPRENHQVKRL